MIEILTIRAYRLISTFHFLLFTASFDHDDDSKTFIRGGKPTQGPGTGDVVGGRAGDVYKMDSKKSGRPGAPLSEMDRMLEELKVVQRSSVTE